MNSKCVYIILLPIFFFMFHSCSIRKNIPQGEYLLYKVELKTDNKELDKVGLSSFLRQTPNSSFPLLGKFRLRLYNMTGTTNNWFVRQVRKLGEPPVIYNSNLTFTSAQQMQLQLVNEGYLNAGVDTVLNSQNKKMEVIYDIRGGIPYTIRKFEIDSAEIPKSMLAILDRFMPRSPIKEGDLFNKDKLEDLRTQLTSIFRNTGYYSFSKDYLFFKVDTTLNSHQADIFLSLHPPRDSVSFSRHIIRNVYIKSGFDPLETDPNEVPDTVIHNDLHLIYWSNNFLRKSTLSRNAYLRPGRRYSDFLFNRTFSAFNSISAIRQTNMSVNPVPGTSNDSVPLLDVEISLVPANFHKIQFAFEGTNMAGDLGIAPNVSYIHQNLFNGGEILNLKLKGAYEFITDNSNNYYEFGFDASVLFPQFLFPGLKRSWREQPTASTRISMGLNNQHRPEYSRQFFNTTLTYRWSTNRNRLSHFFDFLDVNYIRMAWVSPEFERDYLNDPNNTLLRTMYQDQLIARHGYSLVYARSSYSGRLLRNSYTLRANVDWGGILPRLITSVYDAKRDSIGQKQIFGIAYAEYLKGDISFSKAHTLVSRHVLAFNMALGVATPYGNSSVLPFEKRYFSGGSNSVRGWSTRSLGPGSYKSISENDFINKVGDIKLDLNIEYRAKASRYLELAGFIDAGNIWTIRNYTAQPGGQFKFSQFYKEIAMSYGLGLRVDLDFMLLRLDFGMKAYDPSRDEGDRWVFYRPNFGRDFAWHFAIGYPF